jgi:hypothetical protein
LHVKLCIFFTAAIFRNAEKRVKVLQTIEGHEKILKGPAYYMVLLTIVLDSIEV